MIWQKLKSFFASQPTPHLVFEDEWLAVLEAKLPLYSKLPEALQSRLRERMVDFIDSTRIEACGNLELTLEMILVVAAQACLLVLNREGNPYPELRTVLIYPSTFSSIQKSRDESGIITEDEIHRLGESWEDGTVILAWDSVRQGALNIFDGHNVTFHEFAHQLDHEDGATDGAPGLPNTAAYRSWARVFSKNYTDFLDQLERGKRTLIDEYGATNPAEFFAVVTETFFEKPRQLQKKRPELYEKLREFYGLDPAIWFNQ
ncbi:zinc-dependent peptidase [Luteolibacter algae]|uniref:Zinc-dependent peptidase n=1 Tax=Luteolibacter algae TaxID=454151 RepID=A0ABW5D6Z0_9BACT